MDLIGSHMAMAGAILELKVLKNILSCLKKGAMTNILSFISQRPRCGAGGGVRHKRLFYLDYSSRSTNQEGRGNRRVGGPLLIHKSRRRHEGTVVIWGTAKLLYYVSVRGRREEPAERHPEFCSQASSSESGLVKARAQIAKASQASRSLSEGGVPVRCMWQLRLFVLTRNALVEGRWR